jgi:hypothetical protein
MSREQLARDVFERFNAGDCELDPATTDPCAWIFDFEGELCMRMETFPNRVEEARALAA